MHNILYADKISSVYVHTRNNIMCNSYTRSTFALLCQALADFCSEIRLLKVFLGSKLVSLTVSTHNSLVKSRENSAHTYTRSVLVFSCEGKVIVFI